MASRKGLERGVNVSQDQVVAQETQEMPSSHRHLVSFRAGETDRCTISNIMLAAQLCAAVSVERIESLT